jgi:hypothetical protein
MLTVALHMMACQLRSLRTPGTDDAFSSLHHHKVEAPSGVCIESHTFEIQICSELPSLPLMDKIIFSLKKGSVGCLFGCHFVECVCVCVCLCVCARARQRLYIYIYIYIYIQLCTRPTLNRKDK